MKVLLVLAGLVPICLVAWAVIRSQERQSKRLTAPTRDLATAVRLLDRVAEADEMMPYLPSETRVELQEFLNLYHAREIGK